jgi:uncharacterized protein (TIGR01244 family)
MDSIFRGDLASPGGRRLAWLDSMLVDHGCLRLLWTNWGVVAAGRLYRANHPTPARLSRAVRRHGLRSLINLRGQTANGSDALLRERAAKLGLEFFDAPLSSGNPPSRERVLALAAALRSASAPVLLYCKSGADRSGFAAAVFDVLEGGTVARALGHLSLRFGHFRRSRAGVLDAFLLRYAAEAEGRLGFLDWVRDEYDAAALGEAFRAGRLSGFVTEKLLARE